MTPSRLRTLHVIPSVALSDGGPSRAIGLMEEALAAAGVNMEVATTDYDGPGRRLPGPFDDQGLLARGAVPPVRRHFPLLTHFYKTSPALARWLWRHVTDYDVVHIHALFSFSSLMAAWAARWHGVPYVVRPLGTLTHYGVTQRRPFIKRLSLRWLEGPILQHAAAVHFTAAAEQDEAMRLGLPLRPVVIPLAVATLPPPDTDGLLARFPALATPGYLLFLSRLDPKKNLESLLKALVRLTLAHPTLHLAVAGDGDPAYVTQLQALAQTLGVAERVTWTGFVDAGLKSAVLSRASVFVLPSFSENFGIAAAEALSAGLPCVLGQGVAIAEAVQAAGAGVSVAPTVEAVASGIETLLRTADNDIREAARRFAQYHYSVSGLGRGLKRLYDDICDKDV